jgi:hypothetical protein
VTGQERKQSKRSLPEIPEGGFFLRKKPPAELAPGYIYSGSAIGVGCKPPQIYLNCPEARKKSPQAPNGAPDLIVSSGETSFPEAIDGGVISLYAAVTPV